MKIFRKTVWQMTPEGMTLLEADSYDYAGPVSEAKGGSPPTPDPAVQTNSEAAANRYDVNSPFGKQTWDQGAREIIGYDSNGAPQYGQRYTQNIELNPSEQKQYDLKNQISEQLMGRAQDQIPEIPNEPFQFKEFNFNEDNTPAFSGGKFDFNADTPDAAKAQYRKQIALLSPEFDKQDKSFEQRMNNSGIPVGSDAYNDSLRQHENDKNFALSQAAEDATTQGAAMAKNQFDTNYGNSASEYDRGQAQRDAQRNRSLTQYNTNAQNDIAARQQNYNELAALLGGQQLNPINAGGGGGNAPLDVAGAYAAKNQADLAKYNAKTAGANGMMGGLFGLGSAALGNASLFSDERLKDDIETVGELPTGEPVVEWHYKWESKDEPKHTGVIAQDVEKNYPDAVSEHPSGYKMVNYRKLISHALAEAA